MFRSIPFFLFFKKNRKNRKFVLYTNLVDEFSFTELKDELREILGISNASHEHLQDKILGPCKIKACEILESHERQTDGFYMLSMGYAWSPLRDFENYLRIVVGLDEDNIQLILKEYNSKFFTYEISTGSYSIKDFSEVVYTIGDHEGTLQLNMMIKAWKENLFQSVLEKLWDHWGLMKNPFLYIIGFHSILWL